MIDDSTTGNEGSTAFIRFNRTTTRRDARRAKIRKYCGVGGFCLVLALIVVLTFYCIGWMEAFSAVHGA